MRSCSAKVRASSALMSSSDLAILGLARMASRSGAEAPCALTSCTSACCLMATRAIARIDRVSVIKDLRSQISFGAQTRILQPRREPAGQALVEGADGVDFRRRNLRLAERQQHADPVGKPQMRG